MKPASPVFRGWLWAALVLTAFKLWLTSGQTVFAIGQAIHDDRLFVTLAEHILKGNWLGPYNQFTLAKGPLFPLFIAGVFWIGLPLMLAQHLFYATACAVVTRSLAPWFRSASAQFFVYVILLWNPMSFDAGNLARLMRQNIYTPLGMLVVAGLIQWFTRREESWRRQLSPALLTGFSLSGFWLTREESVWLLPAVGLLFLAIFTTLGRKIFSRWRTFSVSLGVFAVAFAIPVLVICTLNWRYYGWFGTVEFRATEFNQAYGALTRIKVGPDLPQVPVTRQMREIAYQVSPAFAQIQPHLEGAAGSQWIERAMFPGEERQMRGGWFMWAVRDSIKDAGIATDAGAVMRYLQRIADEINAACDSGRIPARPPRSGFLPPLGRDSIAPIWATTVEYGDYFLGFKGFTAYSPDSSGDYADLKPFRDLVGNRVSHAPRSLDPFPENQGRLERAKVDWLEQIGLGTAKVFSWAGPFLLLLGVVRLLEAAFTRRPTFLLWLATAMLAAVGAYFTINVLIHVTSFPSMSPAAMAAAYPLYLLALIAIATDAIAAWSRPAPREENPAAAASNSRWRWLIPAGPALLVFAARLREIHLYAGEVPYNDQWFVEAKQLIQPWLEGTLRPWTFFTPHFEHLPMWTRLSAWLQVAITGRWDPLLQMTVNAALHSAFLWLALRWVWQQMSVRAACFVTAVLVLGGALPHAWENIAWGFQSQFPFALIFLFLHVQGACTHGPGSRGWWLAQAAGVAALFTLASMWVGPLVIIIAHFWLGLRDRRSLLSPALIAALGIGLLGLIHVTGPDGQSFAQAGRAPMEVVHSLIHLLSWPSGLPGAAAIVQLPWIIHALRIRRKGDVAPLDHIIFVLGLWTCAQAAGLALARAGDTGDYVSRYGDLLFIGVFANALALTRLVPIAGRARAIFFGSAILWCAIVAMGLFVRATEGHARYFHQTAAQSNELRRSAIAAYLANGDRSLLEKNETRWVLTQSSEVVTELLDRPTFRALLPHSVNPANPDTAISAFNRRLQAQWPFLALAGFILFAVVAGWKIRRAGSPAAALCTLPPALDAWPVRLATTIAVVSTAAMFLWANPLVFNREVRWRQILGGEQALKGMSFHFATPSEFGPERLQGAAPLNPIELRNQFFGTAPAGPGFTGTVLGSPFVLSTPWLVVPYAGYPVGDGNGLRLQVLTDGDQRVETEIGCHGPNQDGVAFWTIEAGQYRGRRVRLVLYDGRTETEAWVAVAPPIPNDHPELATSLAQRLQNEKHAGMHLSLGVIALVATTCAICSHLARRRTPASSPRPAR